MSERHPMRLYLASKSPRRKELLKQMGIEFEILEVDTPEIKAPHETAVMYSLRVTKEKLSAAREKMHRESLNIMPVLCADTEVILDGAILGKPLDQEDAYHMLKKLSGRNHQVITTVGIAYFDYQKLFSQKTTVTFETVPDDQIHHYLASGDYKDKAGAYGIQSYIGQFISSIEGCFYSVMGLPLNTVRQLLRDLEQNR